MEMLNILKPELQKALQQFFAEQKKELEGVYSSLVIENLLEFCTCGKMVRGLLFLFIALKGNLNNKKELTTFMPVAIALELVHASFLIHDDIMDKSLLRRGKESVHHLFLQKSPLINIEEKLHYGYSMAICVGDLALFMAQKLLLTLEFEKKLLTKAHIFALNEWNNVCLSQMLDVHLSALPYGDEVSLETILELYKGKTARYTFSLPLVLGAIFNDFNENNKSLLYNLGVDIGILFQISDDYLDLFGNEELTGKSAGQDISEKKKTIYLYYLYNSLTDEEKDYFNGISNNKVLKEDEFNWVKNKLIQNNIEIKVENIKNELKTKVESSFSMFGEFTFITSIIKELLNFSLKRTV